MFNKYLFYIVLMFLFSCSEKREEVKEICLPIDLYNNLNLEHDGKSFGYIFDVESDKYMDSLKLIFELYKNNENGVSIVELLETMYIVDQVYRDSFNCYENNDNLSKKRSYMTKIIKFDSITINVLRFVIQDVEMKLNEINSADAYNAIWLIAVHSGNREVIKSVFPIVEYGCEMGYIGSDGYALYIKRYVSLNY